jgi:hypothetical protein
LYTFEKRVCGPLANSLFNSPHNQIQNQPPSWRQLTARLIIPFSKSFSSPERNHDPLGNPAGVSLPAMPACLHDSPTGTQPTVSFPLESLSGILFRHDEISFTNRLILQSFV